MSDERDVDPHSSTADMAAPNPEDDEDNNDPASDQQQAEDGAKGGDADDGAASQTDSPSKRRKLREEARSIRHALTHLPKNPYCGACRQGKMKQYSAH